MKNQLLLHLIMGLQIPFNYIRSSKPFTRFSWHSSNIKIIRSKYWFWGNKWKQRRWNGSRTASPNPSSQGAPLLFMQKADTFCLRTPRGRIHTHQGWRVSTYQGNETWCKVFPRMETWAWGYESWQARVWGLHIFNCPIFWSWHSKPELYRQIGFYIYGKMLLCREVLIWLCFREKSAAHVNIYVSVCVYTCINGYSESLLVYKLEVTKAKIKQLILKIKFKRWNK